MADVLIAGNMRFIMYRYAQPILQSLLMNAQMTDTRRKNAFMYNTDRIAQRMRQLQQVSR